MSNQLDTEAEKRKTLVGAILNSELSPRALLDILDDFESSPSAWEFCPNCDTPRHMDEAYCWFCHSPWLKQASDGTLIPASEPLPPRRV